MKPVKAVSMEKLTDFGTRVRATAPGELIHCDVCGPFEMPSFR